MEHSDKSLNVTVSFSHHTNPVNGFHCSDSIPTTGELFSDLPTEGYVLVGVLALFSFVTLVIYIDEVCFIHAKKFTNGVHTMWVLACFPVFSATGLLGVLVPKSGTLVDLMANAFFATCLFNFGKLMVEYMGGPKRMWSVIEPERKLAVNTPPCGCCCCCIPPVTFTRSVYNRIRFVVMQIAVVRPLLMFIAVVLWANGSYQPGKFSIDSAFGYVVVANIISTMSAVYGLMLFRNAFQPDLGIRFLITGKILCIQLSLLASIFPNVIINLLVVFDVIKCSPLFPSRARGEEIYHGCVVLLMLPLALLGQKFFRRVSDSDDCGREVKRTKTWTNALKVIDAKGWLGMSETQV